VKITKITRQKRKQDRYSVIVDGSYAFSISANDLIKENVATGDEISSERIEDLKLKAGVSLLLYNSIIFLGSRPHSELEVNRYLKRKIYKNEELNKLELPKKLSILYEVIRYLKKNKYIDDKGFAEWISSQRLSQKLPKGRIFIKQELAQKGIDPEISDQIIKAIPDEDEKDRAVQAAKKKLANLSEANQNPIILKQKILKYLMGRGFEYTTASSAVDSILTNP